MLDTHLSVGYKVKIIFIDNKSNDSLREFISEMGSRENMEAILLDSNIGKAKAVQMASEKFKPFQWMISCDSDIMMLTPGWPGKLVDCYKKIPQAGMVSVAYEQQNNPMPPQANKMSLAMDNGDNYTFHYGAQVAGGCFVTRSDVWDKIGYKRNQGVYGGIDGLFRQTVARCLKRKCGFIYEIRAQHLDDREEHADYHKWKLKVQSNIKKFSPEANAKILGNVKGFWDK